MIPSQFVLEFFTLVIIFVLVMRLDERKLSKLPRKLLYLLIRER